MSAQTISKKSQFKYDIIRSERKTADIVIERDGSVTVRAPQWADDKDVAKIVESRHFWIYQALAEWRDLNATKVLREYKNGEGFLYLGRAYRLSLIARQKEPLKFKNGRFQLRRDLIESGEIKSAKQAFQNYYIEKGLERITERLRYFAPKVGVEYGKLDVRELGNRWASCTSKGNLAFHWKCMMAPQRIIDYIIVHELCHLHHRDHSQAFWNEIDKVMPDYRERKEWLRINGAGLDV